MHREDLDETLLAVAISKPNLITHYQPKEDNRRWGVKRTDLEKGAAWVSPRSKSNQFVVLPTGDFRRFMPVLSSHAIKEQDDQTMKAYYFDVKSASKIFDILSS